MHRALPFREREREREKLKQNWPPHKRSIILVPRTVVQFSMLLRPFLFPPTTSATKSPWRWSSRVTSRDFLFSSAMTRVNRGHQKRNFLHAHTNAVPILVALFRGVGNVKFLRDFFAFKSHNNACRVNITALLHFCSSTFQKRLNL